MMISNLFENYLEMEVPEIIQDQPGILFRSLPGGKPVVFKMTLEK